MVFSLPTSCTCHLANAVFGQLVSLSFPTALKRAKLTTNPVWAYGEEWPEGGELDIIEGANTAHKNIISAHTGPGCFQDSSSQADLFTGAQRNEDCYVGDQNIGCGYNPPGTDASSYGDGFNAVGGGVYAMEWDSDYIKVWHFARGEIPADIGNKAPNPENWGKPQGVFGSDRCDVDEYFKDMSLVINIVSFTPSQPPFSRQRADPDRTSVETMATPSGVTQTLAPTSPRLARNTSPTTPRPSQTPTGMLATSTPTPLTPTPLLLLLPLHLHPCPQHPPLLLPPPCLPTPPRSRTSPTSAASPPLLPSTPSSPSRNPNR